MPYVITSLCVGVKDRACVDVCPVDCIYEGPDQLYISPIECIDCGVCAPVCPVAAIFSEGDVPGEYEDALDEARAYVLAHPDAPRAAGKTTRLTPRTY